ncbi:MAG: tetratricopeptide repeat protein [Vicinamibacteria bacterium]
MSSFKISILAANLAAVAVLAAASGWAQTDKPSHKHYKEDEKANVPSPTGQLAPRLQNLGPHTFLVTTLSRDAQLFMNQGLNLAYGFNHAEAGRSFREAARLDPSCAMAFWGQALVLGPNINAVMDPANEPLAYELVQKAVALKANASAREQDYIDALAKRYTGKAEDRAAADKAYSDAMREVAKKYPEDLDAQAIYAESVMDLRPWGYWMRDGEPYEGTAEVVELIESVMERDSHHPLALHLYIHLIEPTATPEKAEVAADRLLTLMPGAGHMVHMPSHIYQRIGRYEDSAKSNEMAALADEDYITQCRAQGLYPMGYYPHNIHFLWFAASRDGRAQLAIDSARRVASKVPDEALKELPLMAGFRVVPYYALTRFGKWDEMLTEPAPPKDNLYMTGVWRYARGLSFLGKGKLAEAEKELSQVKRIAADPSLDFTLFSPNSAAAIFSIAPEVLAGEIAAARKNYDEAIAHLSRAVRLEDSLVYTEPSEWHYPPRHSLAAVLLASGRAREAEAVYWEDLKSNRENGWALYGLMKSLEAQGKNDQAAVIQKRFEKAWATADVKIQASRMQ